MGNTDRTPVGHQGHPEVLDPVADDLERASAWLGAARDAKVEKGDQIRIDSTAVETHILEPSDSRLLFDGVRVLTRLLVAARKEPGAEAVRCHDHRRAAKRRVLEIQSRRGEAGGRKTHCGHKVNFATGRGGLVLDAVVEDGNPADSARCLPMLERHVERCGATPSRAAFDGGYASVANLRATKDPGGGARRVPQEARHEGRGHDPVVVNIRAAQALSRRKIRGQPHHHRHS